MTELRNLMASLFVRPAQDADSNDIFNWRNDKTTRAMSLATDFVDWETHIKWYKSALKDPNTCILICCFNKTLEKKVGVVRFSVKVSEATVSINVSPYCRGKGLAKMCLRSSIGFFMHKFPKVINLEAQIKSTNNISRKAFENVGFVLEQERDDVEYFILKLK